MSNDKNTGSGGTVTAHSYTAYRQDWLDRHVEEALDPTLPIIDTHHHLYERPRPLYLFEQLLADTRSGHHIAATVFVDCNSMYRVDGPEHLRCVGETEFANGYAAMSASGVYGPIRLCAGIVSFGNLHLGATLARETLEAQVRAGNGRFRGVRQMSTWDPDPVVQPPLPTRPPGLLLDKTFREGFAELAPLGLSFDSYLIHPQLVELIDLARSFPDTRIVLNHIGTPAAIGRFASQRAEVFKEWSASMHELARCHNVSVKIGGMGLRIMGFGLQEREEPPTSQDLATLWQPYVESVIQTFGPDRCMFESNFPPDRGAYSYGVVWNAFKRLSAGYSAEERRLLFAGTAARVYRLDVPGLF